MDTATAISLIIGAWGAGLSTFLVVRQVLHDRRTLKVVCMVAFVNFDNDAAMRQALSVRVVNEGRRPGEVIGERADGIRAYPRVVRPSVLPALLGDGQSAAIYFDKAELEESDGAPGKSRAEYAFVTDASRNEYRAPVPQPDLNWTPHTDS